MVFLLLLSIGCSASGVPKKVVMVVLPAVSLDDLTSPGLPNIHKLMDTGAIGLMNSRTAGRLDMEENSFIDPKYTPESGYLTLGAGTRAIAGIDAREAFNRLETVEGAPAYKVLTRRTLAKPGSSEVVHPGIAKLKYDNASLNYQVTIGMLGTTLRNAGLKTAVVGNSDAESIHREVSTICMDENGLVDLGDVQCENLLNEAARCIKSADFTVIELGDTARLDRNRLDMMDEVYARRHTEALKQADRVLGDLMPLIQNAKLIILSPYPPSDIIERTENSLCPILVSGFNRGLLTSGSTQIPGVIANTDIAPTVISWLGIPVPANMVGRAVVLSPCSSPVAKLQELSEHTSVQALNLPILRQMMTVIIVLVGIITALWLIISTGNNLRKKLLPALILLPSALAPAMLLMGLFATENRVTAWIVVSLIAVIMTAVAMAAARRPINALMTISLSFIVLIVIDLTTKGILCRQSVMGYSIVDGSRYYGIGNEFMGAVIGSGLVGIGLLLHLMRAGQRASQMVLLCGLIFGAVLVGAPGLGSNTGGAIAVVTAFGFALATITGKQLNYRRTAGIISGVIGILTLFAVLDSLRGQAYESHLGKAARLIFTGGFEQIGILIKRKLMMNLLLIRVSVWSRLLIAYMISIAVALKSGDAISRLKPMPLHLRTALVGAVSGTIAALIFNDSGVVAAGTCFVYTWSLMLLMAADTENQ